MHHFNPLYPFRSKLTRADQDLYDAVLDTATDALRHLLGTPVLDLRAFSSKLDLVVAHQAWELSGGEACLEALKRDARRLAGTSKTPGPGWSRPGTTDPQ